mgnify:CR=1 FL=1
MHPQLFIILMVEIHTLNLFGFKSSYNQFCINKFNVKDDLDGRFDALALCVSLVMRRLKGLGDEGSVLSQQLFDTMFADMDLTLREMGAGDIGVAKRVRVMSEAFAGRLNAYATSLDRDDRDALAAALERNLLRGTGKADAELLNFVIDLDRGVQAVADDVILAGRLD